MDTKSWAAKEVTRQMELFRNIKGLHQEMVARLADVEISEMYFMTNFYSQSKKVYKIQRNTQAIIDLLRRLAPSGMAFNPFFEEISKAGTKDIEFVLEHNDCWTAVTRPMLEAFLHAQFFLRKAVECGCKFKEPPMQLISPPSEWVAICRLFIPVAWLKWARQETENRDPAPKLVVPPKARFDEPTLMIPPASPSDRVVSLAELESLRASLVSCFKGRRKPPKVGLFWFHRKKVIGDFYALSRAALYGQVLGPCSYHYKFWPTMQRLFPELRLFEYDLVPRGRVLFDLVKGGFVILSSKRITSGKTAVAAIKRKFHIPSDFPLFLEADLHYEDPIASSLFDDDSDQ